MRHLKGKIIIVSLVLMISATTSIANDRDDCTKLMLDKKNGIDAYNQPSWQRIESKLYKYHSSSVFGFSGWAPTDPCVPIVTGEITKISQFASWVEQNFTTKEQVTEFRQRGNMGPYAGRKWGNVFLDTSGKTALQIVGMTPPKQIKRTTKKPIPPTPLKSAFIQLPKDQRKLLQANLKELGYYTSTIDGLYGRGTSGALTAYNKEQLGNSDLNASNNAIILVLTVLGLKTVAETGPNGDTTGSDATPFESASNGMPQCKGSFSVTNLWTNCFGVHRTAKGNSYSGEFKSGLPHGQGTFSSSDGNKYVGEWRNGKENGQGTWFYVNGDVEEGIWKDGEFQYAQKLSKPVIASKVPTAEPEVELPENYQAGIDAYNSGDFKTAMEQAKLLAPLGNADAQFYLGKMYAEGKGTLQRNTHAHMWFNLASANGHSEAATERDALTEKMTPTAVEKAQELAAACMDSDYQDCSLGKKPKPVVAEVVVEDTVAEYTADNKAAIKASFRGQSLLKRKQIQFALRKLNYYSSSVDGIWGKRTEQALVSFGQAEKLSPSDTQGIFKSILSKVDVPSSFAVARKKTCADNVRICETSVVCQQAVVGNNWETRSKYMPYVTEAKRRGLTCGLGQVTATADEPKKWGKAKALIAIVGAIAAANAGHADSYAEGLLGGSSSSSNSYRAPTPTYTAPPQQQPWVQPKSSVNYNRIGNTVLGSDGSSCNKIGPSWICN